MKNKYILVLFLVGVIITFLGALFKITHWEFNGITGNMLITVGLLTKALAALIFIIKLLGSKKVNEFLDK
jgi:gliding motility-associated GldL-like protein